MVTELESLDGNSLLVVTGRERQPVVPTILDTHKGALAPARGTRGEPTQLKI